MKGRINEQEGTEREEIDGWVTGIACVCGGGGGGGAGQNNRDALYCTLFVSCSTLTGGMIVLMTSR